MGLPEAPAARRHLAQLERLARNGRPAGLALALRRFAESAGDADAFFRNGRSLRTVKEEAQRLIGASPEVRDAYERAFGPAGVMLGESPSDPSLAYRVAVNYPRTRAGAAALYRVATMRADGGPSPRPPPGDGGLRRSTPGPPRNSGRRSRCGSRRPARERRPGRSRRGPRRDGGSPARCGRGDRR